MTGKSLLTLGALALVTVSLAFAKTYDIDLLGPARAGNVELKAGDYKLKVEGSQAVFTDEHGKSVSVPVKVETNTKKFPATQLETSNQNGIDSIQAIDLGDSSTRLTVGQ